MLVRHDDSKTLQSEYREEYDSNPTECLINLSLPGNKRPQHTGSYGTVRAQKRFDRLMYYLNYRLRLTYHSRLYADIFRLRKTLQNLELMLKYSKFSAWDPIIIFDFLTHLVEKASMLETREAHLVVLRPHLLTSNKVDQYRATVNWL